VTAIGLGDDVFEADLFYVGGGQDREQALIAPDLVAKGPALHGAVEAGSAFLAVCGGYQLLGRFYRDRAGAELPGIDLLPLHTVAGDRRMIGDVLLDCEWAGETLAGFENHAGRTHLDEDAEPLGRVIAGFGNDGAAGYEGSRAIRGSPTACSQTLSRTRPTARSSWSRSPTSSRQPRTRCPPSAPATAAAATERRRASRLPSDRDPGQIRPAPTTNYERAIGDCPDATRGAGH
jgi:hypothetical protein